MNEVLEVRELAKAFKLDWCTKNSLFRYLESVIKRDSSSSLHWALQNINFTLKKGEIFGIVGSNGAGKTTLIRTITGIYRPTKGYIYSSNSISALIDLSAVFHPDLYIKQNMYLFGAYFGLTRSEIDKKFDEIIYFAGLENFIDRKLKSYSSGMIDRLALALVMQLKSDILIFDDVFHAEDLNFRHKYLNYLKIFRDNGGTIILTSHDLELFNSLCQQGLYLDKGKQIMVGDIGSVIHEYKKEIN